MYAMRYCEVLSLSPNSCANAKADATCFVDEIAGHCNNFPPINGGKNKVACRSMVENRSTDMIITHKEGKDAFNTTSKG